MVIAFENKNKTNFWKHFSTTFLAILSHTLPHKETKPRVMFVFAKACLDSS